MRLRFGAPFCAMCYSDRSFEGAGRSTHRDIRMNKSAPTQRVQDAAKRTVPVPGDIEHVVGEDIGRQAEGQERHHARPRQLPRRQGGQGQGGRNRNFRGPFSLGFAASAPAFAAFGDADAVSSQESDGGGRGKGGRGEIAVNVFCHDVGEQTPEAWCARRTSTGKNQRKGRRQFLLRYPYYVLPFLPPYLYPAVKRCEPSS